MATQPPRKAFFLSTSGTHTLSIILDSDGRTNHAWIQNPPRQQDPSSFFSYTRAWLEYQLPTMPSRCPALTGPTPQAAVRQQLDQQSREARSLSAATGARIPLNKLLSPTSISGSEPP